MQPESAAFLWDVREAGVRITTFTEGLTGESYAADELRKSAVERQLPRFRMRCGVGRDCGCSPSVIEAGVARTEAESGPPKCRNKVPRLIWSPKVTLRSSGSTSGALGHHRAPGG